MGRRQGVGGATKSVAVKFIIPSKTNSERHREMFLSEARLSMMLSHSNVIQVFDAGEDDGRLYMVMEWVDGMNLSQFLAHLRNDGKQPSLSLGGFVIGEVLKGLAYAHNLYHEGRQITIVHRDISPQNVLVSVSGEVKLLDFGVARLAQEETSGVHIKGKLRYMAPEHLGGSSKAPTVDVYGAGAILHELIEGTKYREGADEMQLYNQILGGHTPPLSRTDTPAELAALRASMLEPDEHKRVQSADHALEMLEGWPGYRSAAGELGRLVRGYMGVNTPRSGIHMRAVPKGAATVDALADTTPPTAATNTRQGAGTGATSPELSASAPGMGTDPSGVPMPGPGVPTAAGMATAASGPLVVRKKGTSALLLGVGAGLLCAVGAVGVVVAMRGDSGDAASESEVAQADVSHAGSDNTPEPEPEPDTAVGAADPEPPKPLEVGGESASDSVAAGDSAADAPEAEPGEGDADAPDVVADAAPEEPPADQPKTSSTRRKKKGSKSSRKPSSSATPAPEPVKKPDPPKATKSYKLKIRSPLTVAYVKIGKSREFVLEPMKITKLPLGKHKVMWRPSKDQPFVQGGTINLTAGDSGVIRITTGGAKVE